MNSKKWSQDVDRLTEVHNYPWKILGGLIISTVGSFMLLIIVFVIYTGKYDRASIKLNNQRELNLQIALGAEKVKVDNEALNNRVSDLQAQIKESRANNTALNNQIDDLKTRLNQYLAQYGDLSDREVENFGLDASESSYFNAIESAKENGYQLLFFGEDSLEGGFRHYFIIEKSVNNRLVLLLANGKNNTDINLQVLNSESAIIYQTDNINSLPFLEFRMPGNSEYKLNVLNPAEDLMEYHVTVLVKDL